MDFSFHLLLACSTTASSPSGSSLQIAAQTAIAGAFVAVLAALIFIRRLRKPASFAAYVVVAGLTALLVPAVRDAQRAARRSSCDCNLKQIGLALQNYADVYKSFPPAYVTDARGTRMHSWRVLILPFMEQKPLYEMYDFNEPWNGPHNRRLANMMPPIYRCPSDDLARRGETSYAAIDGPGTVFSGSKGSTFTDIKDGTSNTVAVVEAAGAGIDWMEPRDLPFSSLRGGVMSSMKTGVASRHVGTCMAVFCDGHTYGLPSTTPVRTLQALFTRAGGEATGDLRQ